VGSGFLVVILVMFGLMWLMIIRPQRQQQRRQADMLAALKVGDEVVTVGGMYGEVKTLDAERVRLEVDADVEIVVARRAIASVVPVEADDQRQEASDMEAEPARATDHDELPTGAGEPAQEPAGEHRAGG
jgi:preprotein translocase subunit YajC